MRYQLLFSIFCSFELQRNFVWLSSMVLFYSIPLLCNVNVMAIRTNCANNKYIHKHLVFGVCYHNYNKSECIKYQDHVQNVKKISQFSQVKQSFNLFLIASQNIDAIIKRNIFFSLLISWLNLILIRALMVVECNSLDGYVMCMACVW